jgi:hypothetical protein
MFLPRRLLLSVTPATWLVSGCFLGGDYSTERETSATPSPSANETEGSDNPNPKPPKKDPPSTPNLHATSPDGTTFTLTSEPIDDSTLGDTNASAEPGPSASNSTPDDAPSTAPRSGDTSALDPSSDSTSGETCSNATECAVNNCANDEVSGPGDHCYWVSATKANWKNAQNECKRRGRGWDLVTPRSEEEEAFIATLLTDDAWLGGQNGGGVWRWTDTTIFDAQSPLLKPRDAYTNWAKNEPSLLPTHICARYDEHNGKWQWVADQCNGSHTIACQGPLPE